MVRNESKGAAKGSSRGAAGLQWPVKVCAFLPDGVLPPYVPDAAEALARSDVAGFVSVTAWQARLLPPGIGLEDAKKSGGIRREPHHYYRRIPCSIYVRPISCIIYHIFRTTDVYSKYVTCYVYALRSMKYVYYRRRHSIL